MSTESKFKIGDLVRLKSGSPRMTITRVIGISVSVMYYNEHGDGKLEELIIHEQALYRTD